MRSIMKTAAQPRVNRTWGTRSEKSGLGGGWSLWDAGRNAKSPSRLRPR
jgi:hypothetical protein